MTLPRFRVRRTAHSVQQPGLRPAALYPRVRYPIAEDAFAIVEAFGPVTPAAVPALGFATGTAGTVKLPDTSVS